MEITRVIRRETNRPTEAKVHVRCDTDTEAILLAALLRSNKPENPDNDYDVVEGNRELWLYPERLMGLGDYDLWCHWAEVQVKKTRDCTAPMFETLATLEQTIENRTEFLSDKLDSAETFTDQRIVDITADIYQRLDAMQATMNAMEQSMDDLKARITAMPDDEAYRLAERAILQEHIEANHRAHSKLRDIVTGNDELVGKLLEEAAKPWWKKW